MTMSETLSHMRLVEALVTWIAERHCNGDTGGVLSDSSGLCSSGLPPMIGRFVPDAYASAPKTFRVIVGEAKTAADLETRRSCVQIESFLTHCNEINGSLFVLAVPWHRGNCARNLIRNIQRRNGLQAVSADVIDNLPG